MTARWMTRWKPAVGFEFLRAVGNQIIELGFEVGDKAAAQLLQIDVAGPHHRGGILIFDQRQQEVLKRRVFMMPLIGERQSAMERLFETARERGHFSFSSLVLTVSPGITSSP